MGGVDVHDQLRLQRYSVQMALKFKKSYKSLFLGLIDIALVNAYIVWKARAKAQGLPVPAHDKFLELLQKQLLDMSAEDFAAFKDNSYTPVRSTAPVRQSGRPGHAMSECPDFYMEAQRRQRACKVCSMLRDDAATQTRKTTKYFCDACSEGDKRLYLCNVARHPHYGESATCFQIWHDRWQCGAEPPVLATKKIQMRKPGKKRSRRQIFTEEENEEKGQESVSGPGSARSQELIHKDMTTPSLQQEQQQLCDAFLAVSDHVVAHCQIDSVDEDPTCRESFELFYETPALLLQCEQRAKDHNQKHQMRQFVGLYNQWQQRHLCLLFHGKEQQAATHCGGAAVRKPWHEESYPLYCSEIFTVYKSDRKQLDASCGRTRFSDAFWEAYANFIATPLCKKYYAHVRGATSHGCSGHVDRKEDQGACGDMFQWYEAHQAQVERECLEVQGAAVFYKGFYAWRRQA